MCIVIITIAINTINSVLHGSNGIVFFSGKKYLPQWKCNLEYWEKLIRRDEERGRMMEKLFKDFKCGTWACRVGNWINNKNKI